MSINPEEITPTVHCNGNSKDSLLTEWNDFNIGVLELFEKIPHESFHLRNHYIRGEESENALRKAKSVFLDSLVDLKNLSESVIEKIEEQ